MIARLVIRDVRRGLWGGAWLPVAFFLLVAALVPFAIGPDARILGRVGGGMLWLAALTAALLPVERLVEPDRADGTLDQLAVHGASEEAVAVAKTVGHWLAFGPLLLIAAIPASVLVGLDGPALGRTAISLLIGTPALAALSVAVAALTAGLPRSGALAGLLMMPMAVPLLIFAAAACGDGESGALKLEAAVALLLIAGGPFVAGAAIRAGRT